MKKYECLYIVNINFDSEGVSPVVARVEEIIKNFGGEIANTQHWGKRKLAYAIDKERYGNYILVHFQGENPRISDMAREFEIEAGVLHYMTIRLDEFPDFDSLVVPQAYEADRKRGPAPGGRRPRRYEDSDAPAESKEETEATEAPAETEAPAPEAEEAPAEAPAETPAEEAAEEQTKVAEEEVAEAPAEDEKPAEEA